MEVGYLTTVTSGFPRALIAAGILKELFQENNIRFPVASPTKYFQGSCSLGFIYHPVVILSKASWVRA